MTSPDLEPIRAALAAAGETVPDELAATPIPGGASRDLWRIGSEWVLRRDAPGEQVETSRADEYRVQSAAFDAGVPVPRPLAFGQFGAPGMLMAFVAGESIPRRVMRAAPDGLVHQVGRALAALRDVDVHALDVPVPDDPCAEAIRVVRAELDATGDALPALELGLRWLGLNKPAPAPPHVVHGDLRLGNLIVGPDGLRAIIDWEFWHVGDPIEDLAWFCARPWRFGNDAAVAGGLGTLEQLLDGYGVAVDPERLRWWDVISQVKWGSYCAHQASLRRAGAHDSLERTVLARRVAEAEWDMLELIG